MLRKIQRPKIKKSQGFLEMILVVVFLLAIALFILILNKAWGDIRTPFEEGINNALPSDSPFNATDTLNKTTGATQSFDRLLPFLIIGIIAFVMISAGAYMQHPAMIIVGIIMFGVVILIAVIYSNAYQDIAESTPFSSTNDDLSIQNKFMEYLPTISFILIGIVILALIWSKRGYGGGGL